VALVRRAVGNLLIVGGVGAFAAVVALLPALHAAGRTLGTAQRDALPENLSSEIDLVLGVAASDLRTAALLVVACGLALVASTAARLQLDPASVPATLAAVAPVPVSLLAAATVPALAFDVAEYPALAGAVPTGYVVALRGIQVLLVVAAVTAALAVGTPDRRRTAAGLAAGIGIAAAAASGANSAPDHGATAVLGAALAAAVLLLAWAGNSSQRGIRQLLTATLVLVVVAVGYVHVAVVMVPFSYASLLVSGAELGADGVPMIGAGLGVGALLLAAYAVGRPPARPRMRASS
jgi:hypothetical protein